MSSLEGTYATLTFNPLCDCAGFSSPHCGTPAYPESVKSTLNAITQVVFVDAPIPGSSKLQCFDLRACENESAFKPPFSRLHHHKWPCFASGYVRTGRRLNHGCEGVATLSLHMQARHRRCGHGARRSQRMPQRHARRLHAHAQRSPTARHQRLLQERLCCSCFPHQAGSRERRGTAEAHVQNWVRPTA
jgi:hypothetical protein